MIVSKNPRIIATFQPQAWINDYAVDIDGKKEFDCTEDVLRMSAEEILSLGDDDYETDELLPDKVKGDHSGPFYISVTQSIRDFFWKLGYSTINDRAVETARKLYKTKMRPERKKKGTWRPPRAFSLSSRRLPD